MKVRVIHTARAWRDLTAIFDWVAQDSVQAAVDLTDAILTGIERLSDFPERCPIALERSLSGRPLRNLIVGNFRIIFWVEDDTVVVVHIRDGRRQPASAEEVSN
jgi:toxin ParE1/3/4